MISIKEAIASKQTLVLDGAFGTELEKYGVDVNDPLWSAKALFENRESIKAVHRSYLEAGAHIIESSGYQATISGFMDKGFSREEAQDLLAESVKLALEARDEFVAQDKVAGEARTSSSSESKTQVGPYVAASVGPYGAYLADGSEYRGDYGVSVEDLVAFHAERLSIFAEEGPDIFACETVPCLQEAEALVKLVSDPKIGRDIPAWISFSCKDSLHISSGETMAEAAAYLDGIDSIVAIGINCTHPSHVESLIGEIRNHSDKPIVVYPNTGELYDSHTKTWHGEGEAFERYANSWYQAGARIIGGCCRTTPAIIGRLSNVYSSR